MKIENAPAVNKLPDQQSEENKPVNDDTLVSFMIAEWRMNILSSDGLTEEDNIEW